MFVNPPGEGFTIEESLRIGARHVAVRGDGEISVITMIEIARFEPEPPLYWVSRRAYTDGPISGRILLMDERHQFTDLDQALACLVEIHHRD